MISIEKKYVFIHIPKCGGVSVFNYLKSFEGKGFQNKFKDSNHKNLIENNKIINISSFYKFTFVRNPWDRILSLYKFWNSQDKNHRFYKYDKPQVDYIHNNKLTFSDFVHCLQYENILTKHRHTRSFFNVYFSNDQNYNFIGRFENFQNDFDIVCQSIGVPQKKLSHSNKSNHTHYSDYYDKKTRDIIADVYINDISHFNYEFT